MSVAKAVTRLALKKILFTTDYSPASRTALPFATALARRYGATLFIAHIMEPEPFSSVPMDTLPADELHEREVAERGMTEFLKQQELEGVTPEVVFEKGEVAHAVSGIISEEKIDLVVLGTHGRGGLARILMGSVAEQIFRHATCPVLTVGPHTKADKMPGEKLGTILYATDFSAGSLRGLDFALGLTDEHGAQLIMVHVVKPTSVPLDYTERLVAESDRKLRTLIAPNIQFSNPPIYTTPVGAPAHEILRTAKLHNADLIVMGAHTAPDLVSHWPLEAAHSIVTLAECPVLSVRS